MLHHQAPQGDGPHRGLTSAGVSAIVRAACTRADLPEVNAHRLRHSAATDMLRAAPGWSRSVKYCATPAS